MLDEEEYGAWNARYQAAAASLDDREVNIAAVAEDIEVGLELLGVTAIEDKLQVCLGLDVPCNSTCYSLAPLVKHRCAGLALIWQFQSACRGRHKLCQETSASGWFVAASSG